MENQVELENNNQPQPPTYTKGLFLNLQQAFGKENLPDEATFTKKITTDKVYRDGVHKNLIAAYGQDNVPDLSTFDSKVLGGEVKKKEQAVPIEKPSQVSAKSSQLVSTEKAAPATSELGVGEEAPIVPSWKMGGKQPLAKESTFVTPTTKINVEKQEQIKQIQNNALTNTAKNKLSAKGLQATPANISSEIKNIEQAAKDGEVSLVRKGNEYYYGRTPKWHEEFAKQFVSTIGKFTDNIDILVADSKNDPALMVKTLDDIKARKDVESRMTFNVFDMMKAAIDPSTSVAENAMKVFNAEKDKTPLAKPSLAGDIAGFVGGIAPKAMASSFGLVPTAVQAVMTSSQDKIEQLYDKYQQDFLASDPTASAEYQQTGVVPQKIKEAAATRAIKNADIQAAPSALLDTYLFSKTGGAATPQAKNLGEALAKGFKNINIMGAKGAAAELATAGIEQAQGDKPENIVRRTIETYGNWALMDASFQALPILKSLPKYLSSAVKDFATTKEAKPIVEQYLNKLPNGKEIKAELDKWEEDKKPLEGIVPEDKMGAVNGLNQKIKGLKEKLNQVPESLKEDIKVQIDNTNKQIKDIISSDKPAIDFEKDDLTGEPLEEKPTEVTTTPVTTTEVKTTETETKNVVPRLTQSEIDALEKEIKERDSLSTSSSGNEGNYISITTRFGGKDIPYTKDEINQINEIEKKLPRKIENRPDGAIDVNWEQRYNESLAVQNSVRQRYVDELKAEAAKPITSKIQEVDTEAGSVGVGGEPKDITNELNKQTFDVGDKVTVRGKEYTVYKPQEGRFVYLETPRGAKKILKVDSNILVKDDKFQTSEEKFLWNKGDVIHTKQSLKETPQAEAIQPEVKITIDSESLKKNTQPEVDRVKNLPLENEDGATFNLDGTKHEGGLVVPVESLNTTRAELTPELINDFVEKNKDKISGDNFKVGIYKFPNSEKVSIDLNIVVDPKFKDAALEFGKLAGQESLFDLDSFQNVKTGATGENPKSFTPKEFFDIAKSLAKGEVPEVVKATEAKPTEIKAEVKAEPKTVADTVADDLFTHLGIEPEVREGEVKFSKTTGKPEVIKSRETKEQELIDEMNKLDLVNEGIDLNPTSTTKEKIDVNELNSRLDNPLDTVEWKNYEGIPFGFTISDQLRTGEVKNPNTGEAIADLKGGIGFNGTKGNENNAWANTTKEEAEAMLQRAKDIYNNNKPLFEKLWKEGKLPDGHIPVAVVKMAETSILSNEAVFRAGIQNIETLPKSNRKKAVLELSKSIKTKMNTESASLKRGVDKNGKPYTENTIKLKKKTINQYQKILDSIKENKYEDIVDVLKDKDNFSLPEKTLIANEIFYGSPTPIGGKEIDISRSRPNTSVSKILIGDKNPALISLGKITDLLTEPSMKNVPNMHIVSIVGVDVKNPEVTNVNHNNYKYGVKGKSIGILEQPVHMKDAFGEAYGSILSQVVKNEAANNSISPKLAMTQGIPVQSGLPNRVFKSAIAKGKLDVVDKLSGFLRQAFPETTFFTSKEAWDAAMADPNIKKKLKDGDVVYAFTTDGNVFINPNLKTTKATLHETGHIWMGYVEENNPTLHKKGLDLVTDTKEHKKAIEQYGDTPLAREEALMELMSSKGDTIVNASQKAKFKEWLLSVYKYVADNFKSLMRLSPKEIENLTLDKFLEGMLADILSGKELTNKKTSGEAKLSYEKGQDLVEQSGKRKEMTEDDKGNYLFFHYSDKKFNKLSPEKVGKHLATGRDERTSVPTSSLYTRPDRLETNVPSDFGYITRVPKEKVYSFTADPLNLMAEAEARFKKENKDRAFDANNQFAYVAKIASEKGFPVTVAEWNIKGTKTLIAKTTEALPLEKYTNIKAGTTNQIEFAKGTEDIKPNAKRRDIQFSKENQDAKIKDFIEMQREKGISDKDIKAGLEKAADRIGLDKNKIDELLTTKKEANAIQEPSPEGVLQPTQEGAGEAGGKRTGMEQAEQGAIPPKEGKPDEAEVGGDEEKVGITKKNLKQLEEDYEVDLSQRREKITDVEMQDMAKNLIDSGYDVAKLVKKSLEEEKYVPTDLELNILAEHAADMKAKIDANSSNADIAKYRDILSAINRGTSEAGRALRMAQVKKGVVDSIADVMADMMDDYKVDELTKEQRVEAEERFKVIEDSLNKYKESLNKVNAELEKLKAEKALQDLAEQNKKDTPAKRAKTNDDYANERKVIIASMKDKWNKASKGGAITAVPLPFSQQLAAIAPDVAKLIGSYLEQGAAKTLDEVRSLLKKDIEDIGIKVTDEEVSRLIAGEGATKKESKNELARQRYEIKEEQKLLLELERLEQFGEPKTRKEKIQKNQRLAELRKKIKDLTGADLDEKFIRAANQRIKTNETKLNKIQEKIDAGDFAKEQKPQSVLDNELLQEKNKDLYNAYLKSVVDKDEAMLNYERARVNDKIKNESKLNKIGRYADIALNTSKGTVAMFDQSYFLVQMLPFTFSHPLQAIRFAKEALLKDFISADRFKRTMAILHESPLYDLIEKTGLAVFEPRSFKSELRTELHGGEKNLWNKEFEFRGKKYSVGQAFERSTTSFMNNARISLFMDRVKDLYEAGKTFENSPEEFKSAARAINELTGQGKVQEHIQMASPVVNKIIWSPKMFASTLNILGLGDVIRPIETSKAIGRGLGFKIKETEATKGFYSSLTPEQRKFALKEVSRFVGMGATLMVIAQLSGADDVDVDPRSSGFGTITFGNKTYNVFGRFASAARTIVQVGGGVRMLGGQKDVLGDKFGDKTAGDVLYSSFGRGKMTPAAGLTSDLILNGGKNYYTKEEITLANAAKSLAIPLAAQDMQKDFSRDNVLAAAGTTVAKLYGANISDKRDFEAKMKSKGKKGGSKTSNKGGGKKGRK